MTLHIRRAEPRATPVAVKAPRTMVRGAFGAPPVAQRPPSESITAITRNAKTGSRSSTLAQCNLVEAAWPSA